MGCAHSVGSSSLLVRNLTNIEQPAKAACSCPKMANLATKLDVLQLKTIVWMDPKTLTPFAVPTESVRLVLADMSSAHLNLLFRLIRVSIPIQIERRWTVCWTLSVECAS